MLHNFGLRLTRSHQSFVLQRLLGRVQVVQALVCVVSLCAVLGTSVSAADVPGITTRPTATPYLNVPPAPPIPTGGFTVTPAFPNLYFQGAITVRPVPGTNLLWVLEREGRIWAIENNPSTTTKILVLDLNDDDVDPNDATPNTGHLTGGTTRWWCQGWDDCGLMGLAFHPEFNQAGSPNRGYFYLGYQAKSIPPDIGNNGIFRPDSTSGARNTSNRVARFTLPANSVSADPASEQILLDQPDRHLWHNGGDLFFDNAGYLYAVNGDEGSAYDPYQNSQRISKGLFGGVLRIDVDWTPASTRSHAPLPRQAGQPPLYPGYGIPNDNPFVGIPGVLEEFYAIGLRSPHRMTYDAPSGTILVGDIGQGRREEVALITAGSNHQWGFMEGFANKAMDGSIRNERIPPMYVVSSAVAAGASTAPLSYTAPTADVTLAPGMLAVGDRVRVGTQLAQISALSTYPHTSVTFSTPLTQALGAATPLIRTTGFTVASGVNSAPDNGDIPSGLGTSTFSVSGQGLIPVGSHVSFAVASVYGSFQIIAADSTSGNTTSITVRPRFPTGITVPVGTWVDRLTVIGRETAPVADFNHGGATGFNAILGGYIYRGSAHPALAGAYLFADNARGTVYKMTGFGTLTPQIEQLFTFPAYPYFDASGYRGISGFGLDHNGELFICRMQANGGAINQSTGQIFKIIRSSNTVIGTPIPVDLADTGAFATDANGDLILPLQPSAALIPYGVNSPLWSDNALKSRWISLPNPTGKTTGFDPLSEQITYQPTGAMGFPAGTVFVKHFAVEDYAFADQRRKLETRLLVRSPDDSVYGVTYKWNASGTQATLLDAGLSEAYTITRSNGTTFSQTWSYPSRDDCLSCHNSNSNHVLGVNSRQLNGTYGYPSGVSDNQLHTWSTVGMFANPPADSVIPTLAKLVKVDDSNAPHSERVRSWLDANCSHCHRPGGVHAEFDARYDTPLNQQGLIDGQVNNALGVANAKVIAPGDLTRSLLYVRDNSLAAGTKMPPIAKNLIDTAAMTTMAEWIAGMQSQLTISISAPAPGSVVNLPDSVAISASVSAVPDIDRVEFFVGGTLLSSDTTAPYTVTWTPSSTGDYTLGATAYRFGGQSALATPVIITVAGAATPPMITLTAPSTGASIAAPGQVTLTADASDTNGSITLVEFIKDGVVIGSDTNAPYSLTVYNLGAGSFTFTARATDNSSMTTLSAPATLTVTGTSGLSATFWDNMDFTGATSSRIDPVIDFDWGFSNPAPAIDQDTYTARWAGTITAPATGTWTFTTTSDDGIRLFIDGLPVISNWTNHGPTEDNGSITMTAGESREFVMEYFENGVTAIARLEWSGPGQPRALVPRVAFTPLTQPTNVAPVVNAGADLAAVMATPIGMDGTVIDDGLPTATLTTTWSMLSGPGTVTFGNAAAVDTLATFSLAGTYVLRLTANDSALSTSDEVQVVVSATPPTNVAPSVTAGADLVITLPASTELDATVSDDALPSATLTTTWTTVSGPGTVTFGNATLIDTSATFSAAGTYVLRLTANDSLLSTSDDVQVTVNPAPSGVAIRINAGGPAVGPYAADNGANGGGTYTTATAVTTAGVVDPAPASAYQSERWGSYSYVITGLPISSPCTVRLHFAEIWWTIPGKRLMDVSINGTLALDDFDIFVAAGGSFKAVVREFLVTSSPTGTITVSLASVVDNAKISALEVITSTPPANVAPSVGAGADLAITLPNTAVLDGTVTDDGLPNATITTAWSTVSGPGTVTFGNAAAIDTSATFSLAGTYVLRLTANDSALSASDDVQVIVSPVPPTNVAPTVNAGADLAITLPNTAVLDGTVTDDGLPSATVTTAWSMVSGPGAVTFGNAAAIDTSATFSLAGTYVLRLTANDSALSASDDVQVTVNPAPPTNVAPTVNAGVDLAITLPATAALDGTITDDGLPNATVTTAWSMVSGPGTVTFGNATAVDTSATFSLAGTYVLRLTANDSALSASDDVQVIVSPVLPTNVAPTVNAGADLAITLPNTAVLDGTVTDDGLPSATVTTAWSTVSGPGTVIFGNAAAIDTSATFSLAGTYVLRLTANDSALSASDDVQVIVSATSQTGQILREWWTNISGTAIIQLTADPRYPDQPTGTAMLTSFEVPTDVMDNYGTRVRGHIIPPTTGQYVFWIAGDDYCQLFLGTTALPGSKVLIARVDGWTSSRQWTKYAAQQSAPITLTAGVEYYIEALHKEGGGGDNLAVGWQMPGGTLERPIPGNRLKPFNPAVIQPPQISLTAPSASGGQLTAPASLTVSANASDADGTIAKVEFLQNGAVVATVTTPPFSTTLTGLTAGYYTVAARATDNDGLATTSAARWLTVINADGTGLLRRDWWSGLTGTSIAQLTSAPGYPGTPSGTDYRSLFEAPTDWANDYGTRLSGYVVAPVTGSYVFWIAGDDNCELWLSSNDSAASKVLIASVPGWTSSREWGKYPAQQSVAITLTAGARYWIEALQKEGGGGDNLAVGWQLPGGTQERPIPGNRLMPPVIAVAMLPQQRPVGWSVRR